jgi:hypothetical protein
MIFKKMFFLISFLACLLTAGNVKGNVRIEGEMRLWHPVILTIDGPNVTETESTFRNYRLDVTFSNGKQSYKVPGFFAADGNAAETSATSGNKWRAIFTAMAVGDWTYSVSFRTGKDIAISFEPQAGTPIAGVDGLHGKFKIKPSKKDEQGFFAKGKLVYAGEHFGQFTGDKTWHVKAGPGSPEDFFGYKDFDNTFDWPIRKTSTQIADSFLVKLNGEGLHYFTPHLKDWKEGDPTWKNGKGKEIIGALNYMSSIGVNALYLIPFTKGDDADNTWPWAHRDSIMTYDVSKLAQWDIVFSHMDKVGISPNYYLCESDNSIKYMDKGDMILTYPIYYRELMARFGYHLGMRFNLGEELKQTAKQQAAASEYLKKLDPYNVIIAGHSSHLREKQVEVFEYLLGNPYYDGPNYQLHENHKRDHLDLILWRERSAQAGKKWIVSNDEAWGIYNTKAAEQRMLTYVWRTHMAGAEGMFQYTAYSIPEIGDITMENFRLIENTQKIQIACKDLFLKPEINRHLPYVESRNRLVGNPHGNDAPFCLANETKLYIVYRTSDSNQAPLDLTGANGVFSVKWYDALKGGELVSGTVTTITGGGFVSLGNPPYNPGQAWAIVVEKVTDKLKSPKNITVNAIGSDACTVIGGRKYSKNSFASVIAKPSLGYEFKNWTENNVVVSIQNPYVFNVTTHRLLTANFEKSKQSSIKISTTESANTAGKTTGAGDYALNEIVTVNAEPNTCYRFSHWTEGDKIVSNEPKYTFAATTARELKAVFVQKGLTVIVLPESGGEVDGEVYYRCGEVITVEAKPMKGYKFDGWYAGERFLSAELKDDINIETLFQVYAKFSLIEK